METKVTTLAEALADKLAPESGTKEKLEYIDIDDIQPDLRNFYELSDIDELAANIELFGLQQPLRVRDDPTDPDKVILVSGHRRRAAIEKLVADGREDLREIACIREREAGSEALQELRLIYANSDTRKMTSAEVSRQAERVEALLYQLKEEGYDFPGRMWDHVAEACKVSKSKLARLKVIREGLNAEWLTLWEAGEIPEETAYQVARLNDEGQKYALITAQNKSRIEYFYASSAAMVGEALAKLDEERPTCRKVQPWEPCPHLDVMKAKTAKEDRWWSNPCAGRCCINCWNTDDCKELCAHALPVQERRKKERRAAEKERREANARQEAPLIARNKVLWERMAAARARAGKSVEEVFDAQGRYVSKNILDAYAACEAGTEKVTINTESPFGFSIRASDALRLCATADLLGVTLDWLLGRTEA